MNSEYYKRAEALLDRLRLNGSISNKELGMLRRILYEARHKVDLGGKPKEDKKEY